MANANIPGHIVKTVTQMGWAAIKNGELLTLAEDEFDVFLTVDRNHSFQQNLPWFNLAVMVLRAQSSRLLDLHPLLHNLLEMLPTAERG
mgnify:FL=1